MNLTDEEKKLRMKLAQKKWRAKQRAAKYASTIDSFSENSKMTLGIIHDAESDVAKGKEPELTVPHTVRLVNNLTHARLLVHQAAMIFLEIQQGGFPEVGIKAFIDDASSVLMAVDGRNFDHKMMYPAAKKMSELLLKQKNMAPVIKAAQDEVISLLMERLKSQFTEFSQTMILENIETRVRGELENA